MDALIRALKKLDAPCDENTIVMFEKYMNGILSWNEKVNLTAVKERDEFIQKHYIDSVIIFDCAEYQKADKIIDVGTGGGFPGIPLAILSPDKEFVLMDSLKKRLSIIDQLCDEIGIRNVCTIHGRAEELGRIKEYRENFDLCVSRAVANLQVLSEYCIPFVRTGGYFASYKGPGLDKEITDAKAAINKLGGSIHRTATFNSEEFDFDHRILFIEKVNSTPSKYPRKPGTPAREPLK